MLWRNDQSSEQLSRPPESTTRNSITAFLLSRDKVSFFASFITHLILLLVFALIPIIQLASSGILLTANPGDEGSSDVDLSTSFDSASASSSLDVHANFDGLPTDSNLTTASAALETGSSEIPIVVGVAGESATSGAISEATAAVSGGGSNDGSSSGKGKSARGRTGFGVVGTDGAMDRITEEILKSVQVRPTTVVWIFDASFSLAQQRAEIEQRFGRIYEEVGRATKNLKLTSKEPLLTSVIGFGETVNLMLEYPTSNIEDIQQAIHNIGIDPTGIEITFTAISLAVEQFRGTRRPRDHGYERNILFIVITDERGNDIEQLDKTSALCQRYSIPIYVLGVPAPFGRTNSIIKYIDPRPSGDKHPRLASIKQGSESLMLERLQLGYINNPLDDQLIDSGFGSYSLSRLCYDTGGIYFTIHPNRIYDRDVTRAETSEYVAFFHRFFDPEIMASYTPDYVSTEQYQRQLARSPLRAALVAASEKPVPALDDPPTHFVQHEWVEIPTEYANAFERSSKARVPLEAVCKLLERGKLAREQESSPRWLAGFDLAYASANMERIRNEFYRRMLAKLKRGMRFKNEENNVWLLEPSDIALEMEQQKEVDELRGVLQQITQFHKGTPWAYLADKELARPVGWSWRETQMGLIQDEEAAETEPPPIDEPENPSEPNKTEPPPPTVMPEPEFKL